MIRFALFLFCTVIVIGLNAQEGCIDVGKNLFPRTIEGKVYQWNPEAWNFPAPLKQKKITGINEGSGFFRAMLEYLPAGYDPAAKTVKYPLIIFFHGTAGAGIGNAEQLCRLFKDQGIDLATHKAIPGLVERETSLFTPTVQGTTREFMVISPQYNDYWRWYPQNQRVNNYPGADQVEQIIDYIIQRYPGKIDLSRVYLTGYSSGANMIMEYVGSSVERAERIAAVMPVSLCSQLGHFSNSHVSVANIAEAKLKTWFVYCQSDACGSNVPLDWVNKIKAIPGHFPPRLTAFTEGGSPHPGLFQCSDTLPHDAWSRAYAGNFRASFLNNGTSANPNDGINQNMYEWFASSKSAMLPVDLKSFTARLKNGVVELNWVTTDEKENASFTIERAGADQKFVSIGEIAGAGNHTGEKEYSFTDLKPVPSLNYYRLVQTDIDGAKTYFDIRRILYSGHDKSAVVVSPNPFQSELNAFISMKRSQRIQVIVTDMTGKILASSTGIYGEGSSEIKIPSSDMSAGMYLLKVTGEDFTSTHKVVKK